MSSCTVVINVYNEEERIAELLSQLEAQTHPCFDVLFVDDGSTDRTAELVQNYRGPLAVGLIRRPHQGLAPARVAGLSSVVADVAVVVDADMSFEPNWLSAIVKAFEDSTVGGAFSRVRHSGDRPIARGSQAIREVIYAIRRSGRNPWMIGHGMALRTAALKQLPIHPHNLYAEDLELSQLLGAFGWSIVEIESPPITTEDPTTVGGVLRRHFRVGRRTAHLIAGQPRFLMRASNIGRFFPLFLVFALLMSWKLALVAELGLISTLVTLMRGRGVSWDDVPLGIFTFHLQTGAAAAGTVLEGVRMMYLRARNQIFVSSRGDGDPSGMRKQGR